MQVVILCTAAQRQELGDMPEAVQFVDSLRELTLCPEADVWMDLLFEDDVENHRPVLEQAGVKTIIVGAMMPELVPDGFVRVNAWPGFLAGNIVEGCGPEHQRGPAETAFSPMNKVLEWVPDVAGMVSARVIATIINEAYFTLAAGIASRSDIDIAMQLGTAYPFGPFAWAEKIGLHRVAALLQALAQSESRYQPCEMLLQEAGVASC